MMTEESLDCRFQICLAGKTIEVEPLFDTTRVFCRGYIVENRKPDIMVSISREDIASERLRAEDSTRKKYIQYSDKYLETLALYRKVVQKLLQEDVLLIHASAVAVDGRGYLFAAKSGTGKSTHSKLWREFFGNRAVMINDDKPLLRITQTGVLVCGTPWDGKHRLSTNITIPLKAICFLTRSQVNSVAPVDKGSVLPLLVQQCYAPDSQEDMYRTLSLIEKVTECSEFYQVFCNMETDAAKTIYEGIRSLHEDLALNREDRM